jgi:DGQHR domain-containing protein
MSAVEQLVVRAVKTTQGADTDVYAFFLYGSDISRIADISRIMRDDGELKGFQRKEIRNHVNSIVEFLDSGPVLFPNAIILAL